MGGSLPLGHQSGDGKPPVCLFEGGQLCAAVHGAGVNLRYLPMVGEKARQKTDTRAYCICVSCCVCVCVCFLCVCGRNFFSKQL